MSGLVGYGLAPFFGTVMLPLAVALSITGVRGLVTTLAWNRGAKSPEMRLRKIAGTCGELCLLNTLLLVTRAIRLPVTPGEAGWLASVVAGITVALLIGYVVALVVAPPPFGAHVSPGILTLDAMKSAGLDLLIGVVVTLAAGGWFVLARLLRAFSRR